MKYVDKVYGEFEFNEDIILKILNCKSILRLKKIEQMGLPPKLHYNLGFSRFEHTLGVLCLCYKFNLSLEHKIAAIFHDLAHTAFSHVYDYLVKNYEENFHDNNLKILLDNDKEIKSILKEYNIDIKQFYNIEDKFEIIKRKDRFLNFDRFDYTLREFFYLKKDLNKINMFLENIFLKDDCIIFKTYGLAKKFKEIYIYFSQNHWGDANHKTRYSIFVDSLKKALDLNLITFDDFYKTDDYILDILYSSNNKYILEKLKQLETGNFKLREIKAKNRVLDIKYISKDKIISIL
ncbi:MAG: HD domain-containing protein [Candidatus ainarchaeum sp.]|nr:HD domain-containing protein [Candidatus ainarchaeum sp.]MDD3976247.1 HD domain-containing protein [Candidatus ainarchaeum sp.]